MSSLASAPRIVLFLPSLAGGGAERVFVGLANRLATMGVKVDLALARAEGPYLGEVSSSVNLVDFAAAGVSKAVPGLVRHLRARRADAILSGLDHANVMAVIARALARTRTRCVVSSRSVPTQLQKESGAFRAWSVLKAARFAYRFSDRVIANSEAVAADLSRHLGVARDRISVIYNPLPLESIERASQESPGHSCFDPRRASRDPQRRSIVRAEGFSDAHPRFRPCS